jgi:hypothetical protein
MLRRYVSDPTHILTPEPLELKEDWSFVEKPIEILDHREQVLRNKSIPLVKVRWQHHGYEGATWELEEEMRTKYPHLFPV